MKKSLVIIILLALTMQSLYRVLMVLDYQVHIPDYLAKCINIDKPQLHCNGQCELMKQIRDREEKEAQQNMYKYEYSSLYLHKEKLLLSSCVAVSFCHGYFPIPITPGLLSQESDPVFRPPIA
ncbi:MULTISPECIES: hypothetical protein [Sphingobacterium]|uniref:Uncharacterized protein n=1 Tax=Sphingobacterium populi TaxID=1812824 RepID=A0ABW5UCV8_9SPHI|nr:hypothetical protein [Sphingobacterium sp. CFCC 11742]